MWWGMPCGPEMGDISNMGDAAQSQDERCHVFPKWEMGECYIRWEISHGSKTGDAKQCQHGKCYTYAALSQDGRCHAVPRYEMPPGPKRGDGTISQCGRCCTFPRWEILQCAEVGDSMWCKGGRCHVVPPWGILCC